MAGDSAQNLIVLSDGTGNSASKQNKTNVWRLYQAIELSDGTQVAEFADGVGTSSVRTLRVLGLALGVGVKRNVLNLYKFLCRNYHPGDRIWAFGFSRGAFTIRVLVRLIYFEGLVSFESEAELNRNALAAYRAYRKKAFPTYIPWVFAGRYLRDLLIFAWNAMTGARSYPEVKKEAVNVHFVGVWDTVAAYGLPIDELTTAVDKWVWPMKFHGDILGLSPNVQHARHALSLDDERRTFHPTPWDETAERNLLARRVVMPGRLRQVWFAGSHSDVGGGYPDAGLSFVPLGWMIDEAAGKGLRFEPSVVEGYAAIAAATGRIYDSRSGFFGALWRYQPRDAQLLLGEGNTPLVHGSVMIRMACGNGYAPISLPQKIDVLMPDGPPVAFDAAAVAQALAQGHEKQRRILTDTRQLVQGVSAQAKNTELFNLVLDLVWWRRIVYFVGLAFVVAAVAFPLLAQYLRIEGVTDPVNERAGGPVGWILDLIEAFLPAFTKPWVATVVRYPAQAVIVLIGLLASLGISRFLQGSIRHRARAAWNVPMRGQRHAESADPPKPGWLLTLARKARTTKWAVGGYRFLAQKVVPAGFLGLSAILVFSLGNSAAFDVVNTIGAFCTSTKEMKDASPQKEILGVGKTFETRSMCHATGLRLIAGGKYRIRLDMDEGVNGEWFDKGIPADVTGFTADSMRLYAGFTADSVRHYMASPLKRWWRENWYQPIARIGEVGNYEQVLQPAAPLPVVPFEQCRPKEEKRLSWWEAIKRIPDAVQDTPSPGTAEFKKAWLECESGKHIRPNRVLISDITADVTGELFLYVNEAVLALPGLTNVFYRGNAGTAKVTVKRILAEPIIETLIKE